MADVRTPGPGPVSRGDFLQRSGRGVLQAAAEVLGVGAEPWLEALDRLVPAEVRLAALASLSPVPRLFFAHAYPVFAWVDGETARAVSGRCPRDGNLVQWHHAGKYFRCADCQSTYDLGDKDASGLRPLPLAARSGVVFLCLGRWEASRVDP